MSEPKYPNIKVKITGSDGNAFSIIGKVTKELRRAKVSKVEIAAFQEAATSGDYNNLLRVVMETVNTA